MLKFKTTKKEYKGFKFFECESLNNFLNKFEEYIFTDVFYYQFYDNAKLRLGEGLYDENTLKNYVIKHLSRIVKPESLENKKYIINEVEYLFKNIGNIRFAQEILNYDDLSFGIGVGFLLKTERSLSVLGLSWDD